MTTTTPHAIDAWEDDPVSFRIEEQPPAAPTVARPQPSMDGALPVGVAGKAPEPGVYPAGSPEFRYWTLADALARGAAFWGGCVPAGTTWQPDNGSRLIAVPDEDVDLNAFYDRNGLHFFHDVVHGVTVYSGESPDVVCHELGHAVLDAVKPELWGATSIEAAAFHESFGDCSAILSNLQLPSVCEAVLTETDGHPERASRLSRLAENLGWALRQVSPDMTDAGCLRSAVNSFFYLDPTQLPPIAPAGALASEPHNFSRVFTGGFFRLLGYIYLIRGSSGPETLAKSAQDAGTLLINGAARASVVPSLYAQVAAGMVAADADLFGGQYTRAVRVAFRSVGILSVSSAADLSVAPRIAAASNRAIDGSPVARIPLGGAAYGLSEDVLVHAPSEPRRFGVSPGLPDVGDAPAPAPERAAASYVEDLLRRGRIAAGPGLSEADSAVLGSGPVTTHQIDAGADGLELTRVRFTCCGTD